MWEAASDSRHLASLLHRLAVTWVSSVTRGKFKDLDPFDRTIPLLHNTHRPEEGAVSQEKDVNPPKETQRATA